MPGRLHVDPCSARVPASHPTSPIHRARAITHLALVHRPLLGAGRAVAPLAPRGFPILGGGPPLRAAIAALRLRLAELQAELLVLLLHPAHPRGQRLPLHVPARLLAQAGWQQEEAAVCGGDMGRAMGTARHGRARPGGTRCGWWGRAPTERSRHAPRVPSQRHSSAPPIPRDAHGNAELTCTCSDQHGRRAATPRPWPPLPTHCWGPSLDPRRKTHSQSRLPTKR